MPYLPPFSKIKEMLHFTDVEGAGAEANPTIAVTYEEFLDALRALLSVVEVDDAWYLTTYPDVAEAIKEGKIASAPDHFRHNGYFEGRWPFAINVDERWYLTENPGVAQYIRSGRLKSAQQHFDHDGYREGRLPFPL